MGDPRTVVRSEQKAIRTIPTPDLPELDSTTPSPSSSVLNTARVNKRKKGFLRDLFGRGKQSTKKQVPPTIVAENNDASPNADPAKESENVGPDNFLQSKRLSFDSSDDPNYKRKRDAIEYSILVFGLFEDISNLIAPAVPHALGQMSP